MPTAGPARRNCSRRRRQARCLSKLRTNGRPLLARSRMTWRAPRGQIRAFAWRCPCVCWGVEEASFYANGEPRLAEVSGALGRE
jgi:hypothetical protein